MSRRERQDEEANSMDDVRVARWCVAIFKGDWAEVTSRDTPTADVLEDSEQWAARFLQDHANPYAEADIMEQRILLGLGTSPDKLITHLREARGGTEITVHETRQDFIISHARQPGTGSTAESLDDVLSKTKSVLTRLLVEEPRRIARDLFDTFSTQAATVELDAGVVTLVSSSDVSLEAVTEWTDRVNLISFESVLRLGFYKTYPGTAVGSFRTGLNWYPPELRSQMGVAQR